MTRTNIDIDDELIAEVMRDYGLRTKREAVDFALRRIRRRKPLSVHEALAMRGTNFMDPDLDIDAIKATRTFDEPEHAEQSA
ncbi:MAG TPA: type II toxin-antitoxin system VapB family antitoxin [Jatrophihabitans sp.]|jgi:Arc/MetJ family transcription regulator|nr:type II toxin-antitoxin system VapB family antitoxin [Jatrophihabitans sp.]